MKKLIFFLFFCCFSTSLQAQNTVMCWIFKMQGCPGVEAKQGSSINFWSSKRQGIGAIGGKRERVDKGTTLKIPRYKICNFMRSIGVKCNVIGASFDPTCKQDGENLESLDTVLKVDFVSCMKALDREVAEFPRGINLNIMQCQDYFCRPSFIDKFKKVLKEQKVEKIQNIERFLKCENAPIEV